MPLDLRHLLPLSAARAGQVEHLAIHGDLDAWGQALDRAQGDAIVEHGI